MKGRLLIKIKMKYKTASPDIYPLLRAFARENRKNATVAEHVLWEHIRHDALGVIIQRQHIIGDFIVAVDTIDVCLVYSVLSFGVKFSIRSCSNETRADELAAFLSQKIGSEAGK